MDTRTITIDHPDAGETTLSLAEGGSGPNLLLLHGGGGPGTVAPFAERLANDPTAPRRVLVPTHPGFEGTPRPESLSTVAGLATLYTTLLDALDLRDVLVVGNSIGGWIAAEMILLASPRVAGYVLVDAVGIEVEGHAVIDFFALPVSEIADYSFYAPDAFRIDPSALPPAAQTAMAANRASLATYAGHAMTDPTLRARLGDAQGAVRVIWGEADRIVDPEYGRAYAAAIPGADFTLMPRTGHLPQLETPDELAALITQPGA